MLLPDPDFMLWQNLDIYEPSCHAPSFLLKESVMLWARRSHSMLCDRSLTWTVMGWGSMGNIKEYICSIFLDNCRRLLQNVQKKSFTDTAAFLIACKQ